MPVCINACFSSVVQLICSRKNKTQEVKQKISDYLEGKDTLFFSKAHSEALYRCTQSSHLNRNTVFHYSLILALCQVPAMLKDVEKEAKLVVIHWEYCDCFYYMKC